MLLPVLSLAYDTDSKQTRERTQTLFRHCNAAGGRLPAAIEVFSGGQCGLRLQGDADGDADTARLRRRCGSGGGVYRELLAPDFSPDAGSASQRSGAGS
jgi:hypothetical protein